VAEWSVFIVTDLGVVGALDPCRTLLFKWNAEGPVLIVALLEAVWAFCALWAAITFEGAELAVLIVAHNLTFRADWRRAVKVTAAHYTCVFIAITFFCGIAWALSLTAALRVAEALKAVTEGVASSFHIAWALESLISAAVVAGADFSVGTHITFTHGGVASTR